MGMIENINYIISRILRCDLLKIYHILTSQIQNYNLPFNETPLSCIFQPTVLSALSSPLLHASFPSEPSTSAVFQTSIAKLRELKAFHRNEIKLQILDKPIFTAPKRSFSD